VLLFRFVLDTFGLGCGWWLMTLKGFYVNFCLWLWVLPFHNGCGSLMGDVMTFQKRQLIF